MTQTFKSPIDQVRAQSAARAEADQADALLEEFAFLRDRADDLLALHEASLRVAPAKPGIFRHGQGFAAARWNREHTHMYAYLRVGSSWTYTGGLFSLLNEADRLSEQECEDLSLAMGSCSRCQRKLTLVESVKRGMGAYCAKKGREEGFFRT